MSYRQPTAIRLYVELMGIMPPIWRRLLVPWEFHLGQLHSVIQAAFGWSDVHLHEFRIGSLYYGDPGQAQGVFAGDVRTFDETQVRLLDFRAADHISFIYVYNLYDNWQHRVTFEEAVAINPPPRQASCLGGKRSRPPEEVGGARGYKNLITVLSDPQHPEHANVKQLAGERFDPDYFDLTQADRDVRTALRSACHLSSSSRM
jgi:hypothetical protein